MRMSFLIFLAAFSCLSISTLASDPWKPIGSAMMKFPQQPSEKAFRAIESKLEVAPPLENADSETHSNLIGAAFLAGASERYKWAIAGKNRFAQQAREILSGKGRLANYVLDDKLIDSNKFDVWWMSYLGSQDDKYLYKLLKFAGNPVPKNDPAKAALIDAATWSFMSNCKQIKGVRDFAEARLHDPACADKRTFLAACVVVQR